jgi:subtilisin family serine protease
LGYNVPSDSAYTFFKYNTSANEIYFDLWADTANFKNAYFSVGCNDTLGNDFGRLNYLNVVADFNPPQGAGVTLSKNLFRNSNLLGQVNMQATLDEGRYHVEFLITPSDASNYWRLQTSGSGKFDLWSSSTLIGSADMTDYIQTGDTSNPQIYIQYPNYRHPDSLKTMVSSWQNSDKVITVANYSNRAGYFDRDSNYQDMTAAPYSEVIGKRFATSSIGPTRDGRMKPDVSATGSTTICTGDANFIAVATAPQNRIKVYVTKKHIRNGGTSMSSPIVAGIAALYLEKRPTATYNEIKQALICTATKDNFTGNTPNFEYGYGKVNAFRALTVNSSCFVYGTNDTACLNYNPLATVDTGGCVAKVYGCTDTLAANYNPLANVSNGNCVYTSVKSIGDNVAVKVLPNPFSGQTVFKIEGLNFEHAEIKIYNQLGELANVLELAPGKAEYLYRSGTNARGIYHYLLFADGKFTKAGKLVIE